MEAQSLTKANGIGFGLVEPAARSYPVGVQGIGSVLPLFEVSSPMILHRSQRGILTPMVREEGKGLDKV